MRVSPIRTPSVPRRRPPGSIRPKARWTIWTLASASRWHPCSMRHGIAQRRREQATPRPPRDADVRSATRPPSSTASPPRSSRRRTASRPTAQNTVDKLNADLETLTQINVGLRRASEGSASVRPCCRISATRSSKAFRVRSVSMSVCWMTAVPMSGWRATPRPNWSTPRSSRPPLSVSSSLSDGRLALVASGLQPQAVITPADGVAGRVCNRRCRHGRVAPRGNLDATAASFASVLNTWNPAPASIVTALPARR